MKDKCASYIELMQLQMDGELNSAGEEALKNHLAVCPTCQADSKAFQRLNQLFLTAEPLTPPVEIKDSIMTKIMNMTAETTKEKTVVNKNKHLFQGLSLFVLVSTLLFLSRLWVWENLWRSFVDSWLFYLRFMQNLNHYIQVGLQISRTLQTLVDLILKSIPSSWIISLVGLTVLLSLCIWRLLVYNQKVN